MKTILFHALVAVFMFAVPGASAATVEDGKALYDAGDYEGAMAVWLPLAEAGNRDAQFRVGALYRKGKGVPRSDSATVEWYLKAAYQGEIKAQTSLGYMFDYGDGLPKNRDKAKCWYLLAARQGYPLAQNNLGQFLEVLEVPFGKYYWIKRAAKQGFTEAMSTVGWID